MESDKFVAIITDFEKKEKVEVTKTELKQGQVLVKMHSAPIHPLDLSMSVGKQIIKSRYNVPIGIGFEGAGQIVELGPEVDENLLNKKVALQSSLLEPDYQGTFREYFYAKLDDIIIFPDDSDYDLISCCYGNPLTVSGLIDRAIKGGHKCVISDASASACGRLLIKTGKHFGIKVINIVRSEESVKFLEEMEADLILNSSSSSFTDDLQQAADEHKPSLYYSAVTGDYAAEVMSHLPSGCTMVVYGSLSEQNIPCNPLDLIYKNHTVTNFWLPTWLRSLTPEEKTKWQDFIKEDISAGGKVFGTHIGKLFSLDQHEEAFEWAKTKASSGKTMFRMN